MLVIVMVSGSPEYRQQMEDAVRPHAVHEHGRWEGKGPNSGADGLVYAIEFDDSHDVAQFRAGLAEVRGQHPDEPAAWLFLPAVIEAV